MRIYLDFDNTLVATKVFFRDYYKPILQGSGSTEREIEVSYSYFANGTSTQGELFSPMRQMEMLGWRTQTMEEALSQIENILREHRSFIFPDVVETLQALRNSGHTLILLTFGQYDFQKQKLISSGIAHLFDEIMITGEDKVEVVSRDREGEEIVFVDDKAAFMPRLNQLGVRTFHMCRLEVDTEKCSRCEAEHEITSLKELLNYL